MYYFYVLRPQFVGTIEFYDRKSHYGIFHIPRISINSIVFSGRRRIFYDRTWILSLKCAAVRLIR